jgi:1-aminocyclopropane-1-carboxylate deaminase/D-cysteine desulfhydrase-like pyridoxal-dependent ACC family enzyme
VDTAKTKQLIREIEQSGLPKEEKDFLIEAAKRHSVFHYERIAEYYAQSSREMQELMEKSALVIIDFGKAIELGYVRLCEEIKNQYMENEDE